MIKQAREQGARLIVVDPKRTRIAEQAQTEVERCLNEHPDVHECAVMGHEMPDRRMTLRAVVQLRDGVEAGEAQTKALCDFVKSRLTPYKYPRIVEYVAELPKTGTGKIDRQALRSPS